MVRYGAGAGFARLESFDGQRGCCSVLKGLIGGSIQMRKRLSSSIEGHLVVDKGEPDKLWGMRYETSLGLNGCKCAELTVSVSYWRLRMHSAGPRMPRGG
jgi:hypothetical protein